MMRRPRKTGGSRCQQSTTVAALGAALLAATLLAVAPPAVRSAPLAPAASGARPVYLPAMAKPAAAPSPAAAISDTAQRAAARLNVYRALAGLPQVAAHPLLTRAAESHARYYVLNAGDPSLQGLGLHRQTPGQPGFSGVEPQDRARAAGYGAGADVTVDENVGLLGDPERLIEAFVDTVNHRWNMLHPSLVDLGYGMANDPAIDVLQLALAWSLRGVAQPARYPGPNQTDVPRSSYIWEAPDPAPGAPRPLGYPITIAFPLSARVAYGAAELRTAAGERVAVYTAQKAWLRGLAIIPARPLQPATGYVVAVSGTRDGVPLQETWSFVTR